MKRSLLLEAFEERIVPAVTIDSGHEAYAWVLINTLRQNPTAFANNLQGLIDNTVNNAFGLSKSDPVIADLRNLKNAGSQANYAAALNLMRNTAATGPLAWEELLEERAGVHNDWMKANGFSHTGNTGGSAIPGYSNTGGAPADTYGYPGGRYGSWGENIGYGVGFLTSTKSAYNSGTISLNGLKDRAAFLDTAGYMLELFSGSLGHLQNLMRPDSGSGTTFNAIGLDIDLYEAPAGYEAQDGVPEASVSTHRPAGYRPNGTGGFIAGEIFQDANANGAFDTGEGAVVAVTISNTSGVANGSYTVTVTANGQILATRDVTINNNNAWAGASVTTPQAPGKPTITGPIGAQAELRPSIAWNTVIGATDYQVRIDNVSLGQTNIFNNASTTNTNWMPTADLISGYAYRVYVRALATGLAGLWSNAVNFTIARPTQTGPATGVLNLRPQLTWSAIAGATRYDVRIDDVSAAKNNIFPGAQATAANWDPTQDLVSGRTYRWQVRAVNGSNSGVWTNAAIFVVGKPSITVPTDLASLRPQFTWSAVAGVANYQVYFSDISTQRFNIFPNSLTATNLWTPPADLVSGRTYRITVRALNSANLAAWAVARTFAIARPTPNGPSGDVATLRPSFDWTAISGASTYKILVNDLTTGKTSVLTATVVGTTWTPSTDLILGHRYRWWVAALNADNLGAWSVSKDFQVV